MYGATSIKYTDYSSFTQRSGHQVNMSTILTFPRCHLQSLLYILFLITKYLINVFYFKYETVYFVIKKLRKRTILHYNVGVTVLIACWFRHLVNKYATIAADIITVSHGSAYTIVGRRSKSMGNGNSGVSELRNP